MTGRLYFNELALLHHPFKGATRERHAASAAATTGTYAPLGSAKLLNLIAECFVEFKGKPVASVKKGFGAAVGLARLTGKVTPHTLRHAAAIWLMQRGVPVWKVAGFLVTSSEVLLHLRPPPPRFPARAAHAIASKHRVSVVETVVALEDARERRQRA